jgi:ubiquinone/menaquinone biosynthesis C-methylase UbiE
MAGNHPVFAPLYNGLAWAGEKTTLGRWRTEALAPANGRLLIVGLGPGYDLAHIPPAVTEIVAVEPAAAMRRIAARRAGPTVRLVEGIGEQLPLPDASVDSALCALVLCTVTDPEAVVREIGRVLKPGGILCVLEHVRAAEGTRLGRLQDRAAPAWSQIAGGCQPHRRTRDAIAAAGFDVSGLADRTLHLNVPLLAPTLIGTARAL